MLAPAEHIRLALMCIGMQSYDICHPSGSRVSGYRSRVWLARPIASVS